MPQQHTVKGTNPAAIWLGIVLLLVIVVGIAVIAFIIVPTQKLAHQVEATATAQAAALDQNYAAGVAFSQAGDFDAAADAFRKVIVLDANYKDAQARLRLAIAEIDAAATTATAASAVATAQVMAAATATAQYAPTATRQALAALYARGQGLMKLGRWTEAVPVLQAVFDVDPAYEDVSTLLAKAAAHSTPTWTPAAPPTPISTPATPRARQIDLSGWLAPLQAWLFHQTPLTMFGIAVVFILLIGFIWRFAGRLLAALFAAVILSALVWLILDFTRPVWTDGWYGLAQPIFRGNAPDLAILIALWCLVSWASAAIWQSLRGRL